MIQRLGAVLVGGKSLRMGGGDKFLRVIDGTTLIDRVKSTLASQVDFIVACEAPDRPAPDVGLRKIADRVAEGGPLAGIHAALCLCNEELHATEVLTVSADTPFIPTNLIDRLSQAKISSSAAVAIAHSLSGTHYVVGLWSADLADQLGRWLHGTSTRAAKDFIGEVDHVVVDFPGRPDVFFNVNTPADLLEARRLARLIAPRSSEY